MLQHNQCFAPTSYNGRCRNKCIENSNHCELHNPKSRKLYIKYKKLSNQTKDIDLNKKFDDISKNISYIVNCYNLYNKTFEARLKHRKFAIAPNLYDQGHDFQFIDLNNKINQCEEILNKLYKLRESKNTSEDDESSDDDSIVIYEKKSIPISQKIKINKEYRASKERETNEYVEKYITQNKIIIERKNLLIYNLCTCISLLFGEDELADRPKIIAIISLIIKLVNIDYFDTNFSPRICKHPECTCTLSYNLSLGEEYFQEPKCFCRYIESFSEESLKFLFEIFLFNKKKILPFVNDINELYEENDFNIIFTNVELVWKNNRLNLQEIISDESSDSNESNKYVKFKKPSEVFAVSRLKNKYYEQEVLKNIFS